MTIITTIANPLSWGQVKTVVYDHWEAASAVKGRYVVSLESVLWKHSGMTTWLLDEPPPSIEAAKAAAQLWEDDLVAGTMSDAVLKAVKMELHRLDAELYGYPKKPRAENQPPRFDLSLAIIDNHLKLRSIEPHPINRVLKSTQ